MASIAITEEDGAVLKEFFDARLIELRREISHTDSPRFREKLYRLEGAMQRIIAQLPQAASQSVPIP